VTDRRITPANGRTAHISLRGKVIAEAYVAGEWARVTPPLADLLRWPDGPRDRQLLMGDRVLVLERGARHAFVQAEKDGYCGYLDLRGLGADVAPSHWVSAPATHLYPRPTIKIREVAHLSLGASLTLVAEHADFGETADGLFVPRQHLRPIGEFYDDPAMVAAKFLGTPYLWGGNSRDGIDCSGLVQAALLACGIACPGDSDLQFAALGCVIDKQDGFQRGDLLFWKGHVAMALDHKRLIHATGFAMSVIEEDISATLARIAAQKGVTYLGARRLIATGG
jgi:cell wall-associated NlpC family hydrolase